MAVAELLGRADEQAALARLLDRGQHRPAGLLLDGEAGIGKTTLWREGIAQARERGFRVLACEPTPTETPLAFAGLGDLLDELPREAIEQLPSPQRNALEISLLLVETGGGVADQRAVSLALLTLMRMLAAAQPLLIAIDDVQWLDSSSLSVLTFALRRVHDGPVGLLMTRRSDEAPINELPLGLDRNDALARALEQRTLSPLSLGAIARLVSRYTGRRVPRPLLTRLFQASAGNPFYAIELARSAVDRDVGQPLRVPEHLRALVSDRLSALPADTQETLLIAAALNDPSEELVRAAGGGDLAEAIEAGVIEIEQGRIRFCHPLHSSVLYGSATPEQRTQLHRRLAEIVTSPESRARHLALGSQEPDERVAAELEEAARRAAARGARAAAAELYEHATRLTPAELHDDLHRRRLETAEHYYSAGDLERSRALVETMLSELPSGPERSDVLVLLAEMMEDLPAAISVCHEAVEAAAGDDVRTATAYIRLSAMSARVGESEERIAAQRQALVFAELGGDPNTLVEALQGVGNVIVQSGEPIDEKLMKRALDIDAEVTGLTTFCRPSFWYGMQLYWIDQLEQAHHYLGDALEAATQASELTDRLHILSPLIEVEFRLGHLDSAERLADEGLEQALDIGQDFLIRSVSLQRLQLAVLRGKEEESRQGLAELMAQAERVGDQWQALSLMSLLGSLEISLGHYVEAWHSLEPALTLQDDLKRDISLGMAPLYTIRPNAIETLIALDELDRAELLLESFEAHVEKTRRPNGIVSSARSRALVEASRGNLESAREALERAIAGHETLPDPFERGRTLLIAGTIERRAKQKRNARQALEEAIAVFGGLGARLWCEKAQVELGRVAGFRAGELDLTATEQQVAELVARGRSNKEVAAQLFMSVRTVEATLSKIYRKLGLESRSELAARLSAR